MSYPVPVGLPNKKIPRERDFESMSVSFVSNFSGESYCPILSLCYTLYAVRLFTPGCCFAESFLNEMCKHILKIQVGALGRDHELDNWVLW